MHHACFSKLLIKIRKLLKSGKKKNKQKQMKKNHTKTLPVVYHGVQSLMTSK